MLKKSVLEQAQESAEMELKDAKRRRKRTRKFVQDYHDEIDRITGGMEVLAEWLIGVTIDVNSASLDLKYAGDKLVLQGIFKALRKLGYVAAKKPGEKDAEFVCYWSHPDSDMRIWMKFCSTVCKRIKVGTKMVEQDVFETRCG